ncbi:diacylglycerol kinase [Desulfopila inferna]|uniref:diacylglycerol kinase n=1 Tax=Desulfopila inferna TaxID=468528 RepID=UPI001F05C034|nr:diacylglycerol kinase [Desulfopila inferna]
MTSRKSTLSLKHQELAKDMTDMQKTTVMKPQKPPLQRIQSAFYHSIDGLSAAFKGEAAFRQVVMMFILLLPLLYFLPIPLTFKLLLLAANFIVLISEILNSAVEAVVDLASPELHELAKKAKDMGSAAVFLAMIMAVTLWLYTIPFLLL